MIKNATSIVLRIFCLNLKDNCSLQKTPLNWKTSWSQLWQNIMVVYVRLQYSTVPTRLQEIIWLKNHGGMFFFLYAFLLTLAIDFRLNCKLLSHCLFIDWTEHVWATTSSILCWWAMCSGREWIPQTFALVSIKLIESSMFSMDIPSIRSTQRCWNILK